AKAKAAYRQKYESDFIIADAAARYFRENGISKLPSYKALQAEIETLTSASRVGSRLLWKWVTVSTISTRFTAPLWTPPQSGYQMILFETALA
ncbi:MAG: hypothetical protein J6B53_13865, partial [Clostridia bacterium]|nr:hypothetical protein [Clostridia bacterium]